MNFRVNNIPVGANGLKIRCFTPKAVETMPPLVKLRQGMNLEKISQDMGLDACEPPFIGITSKGIHVEILKGVLEAGWSINDKTFRLREGEEKCCDNYLQAILWRFGAEEEVLEPFNVISALKRNDMVFEDKVILFAAYLKTLEFDLISCKAKFLAWTAVEAFSDDVLPEEFAREIVNELDRENVWQGPPREWINL